MKKDNDSEIRKEKKNKEKLSYTIIGVILYSVLLVSVMTASYVGVKVIIKNHKQSADVTVEETTEEEVIAEEEITPTPLPKPENEEVQTVENDVSEHEIELSDVINSETGFVDYSNILVNPGKRDASLKWEDLVFSRVENINDPVNAAINNYYLRRIDAVLTDQKPVEYKAYINPETGLVEKVTESVYTGDGYDVYNYYYNEGCVNYVTQDRMIINKPVSLSSADIESRYYFNNDVLVRFIFCDDGSATEYSVGDLSSYSSGTVDQYNYLEKDMINRAYIVYNLAKNLNDTEIVYGYVLDEFSMPLEDAEVTIKSDEDNQVIVKTQTDGDGYYKAIISNSNSSTYTVSASKSSLRDVSVYGITSYAGASKVAVDPIYMSYEQNGGVYNVAILVRDAFDSSKALAGATIKLRYGINNHDGEVFATGTLDSSGMATVPMLAGSYTAEVSLGGYETSYFPVIVRIDHVAAVGFAVPDVKEDTYSVVLSWETTPLDLDIKAVTANQNRVVKALSDSIGSTSAEAFILDNSKKENYHIYVCDNGSIINNDPLSYKLTSSSAQVYIYSPDGQIASMHVPVASAGIIWEPCEIYSGQVLPVNNYFYTIEDNSLWTRK